MGLLDSFLVYRTPEEKLALAEKGAATRGILGQYSARSKLLGGPDPLAADPTANYAPITAPTGFTPAAPGANLSQQIFEPPKQNYTYAEPLLGKERLSDSGFSPDMAVGLMNDPGQMARVKSGLLGQAEPDYGLTMERLGPLMQNMTPSQRMAFQVNPAEAGKRQADTAFAAPQPIQLLMAARDGLPEGSPQRAEIQTQIDKLNYIKEKDPAYIREQEAKIGKDKAETAAAEARANLMRGAGIDEDAIEMRAQMWAAGDQDGAYKGIPQSIYGSAAREAISKRGAQLAGAQGRGGAEQAAVNAQYMADKAGMRTAGQAGAKMDTLATEVEKFAQLAQDASSKLPRGSFVPLTKAEQLIQSGTSSPELAEFVAANTSLVNAYSAVAGRGTPTVAGQEHAYKMLSTAMSPEAYAATVKQLIKETAAAKASPSTTMEDIRGRITQTSKSGEGGKSAPQMAPSSDQKQGAAPQAAIEHLKANPALRVLFDKKYGEGASKRVLGY